MSDYDNVIKLRQTNQLKSLYTYVTVPAGGAGLSSLSGLCFPLQLSGMFPDNATG